MSFMITFGFVSTKWVRSPVLASASARPARAARGPHGGGETVGSSSSRSELGSGGGSTEVIIDHCSDANRKVLVKGLGENLLPTAQRLVVGRPGPPVSAPCAGNRHIDLCGHLSPGQALVTQL
jgi:hypothetical protein